MGVDSVVTAFCSRSRRWLVFDTNPIDVSHSDDYPLVGIYLTSSCIDDTNNMHNGIMKRILKLILQIDTL